MKIGIILVALAALGFVTFTKFRPTPPAPPPQQIVVIGADSMVNIAQAWAEKFGPTVEVQGGGSGIGFASLINGTAQIAMSVREPEPEKMRKLTENFGRPPVQTAVAYEVIAVFVNKANTLEKITFDELRGIYFEGGKLDDWKQLDVHNLGSITKLSRQNPSGTPHTFQSIVGDSRSEFRRGCMDLNGSFDNVMFCAKTPAAICYAGIGYAHNGVKALAIVKDKDCKPVLPSPATVRDGSYPLGRKFYFVTTPKADATTRKFVEFVTGPAGRKVAMESGHIPLAE